MELNKSERSIDSSSQYITFYLGNEMYGVAIQYLQEIIRVPDVIKVPRVPLYIRGLQPAGDYPDNCGLPVATWACERGRY